MTLFVATRGASHPWLTVPTAPDATLPAGIRRELHAVRAVLKANAQALGQPCALRAVVLDACPDTKGRQLVALVFTGSGRVGKMFTAPTLAASASLASRAAATAAERVTLATAVSDLRDLTATHGAPGAPRSLFTPEA